MLSKVISMLSLDLVKKLLILQVLSLLYALTGLQMKKEKMSGMAEVGELLRTTWISLMCTSVKLGKGKRLCSQYEFSFCV